MEAVFVESRDSSAAQPIQMNPGQEDAAASHLAPLQLQYRGSGHASAFCWLTAHGVYHGSILLGSQRAADTAVYDFGHLQYPADPASTATQGSGPRCEIPQDVTMTEFHFLLLYPDKLVAVSRLNSKPACVATPPSAWKANVMRGLVHDTTKATIWAWGSAGLLRVRVVNEDRHAWQLHLEAANFENALSHCSATDTSARDAILTAQAHHEFGRGSYELAAMQYAKTALPIEQVACRFHVAGQGLALKTYLLRKLDTVDETNSSQLTLLCTWLTQIFLAQIYRSPGKAAEDEFVDFLVHNKWHLDRT